MKKLLFALLLLPSLAWGQEYARMNPYILGGGVSAAAGPTDYCTGPAACTETNPDQCSLLCEDVEGTTDCGNVSTDEKCRSTWTESITSGDSITWGYSTSLPTYCTGTTNTNGVVRFVISAASHDTYIYKDLGASAGDTHLQFYFNLEDGLGSNEAAEILLAAYSSDRNNLVWRIHLKNTSGNNRLELNYINSSAGWSALSTGTLSLNTFYRVNVSINRTTGAVAFKVNGEDVSGSPASDGYQGASNPARYVWFETRNNESAITFQLDNIAFDADTDPSACQ